MKIEAVELLVGYLGWSKEIKTGAQTGRAQLREQPLSRGPAVARQIGLNRL